MQYILSQALLAIAFSGMASAAPTEVKELQCNGAKYLGKLNLVQGEPAKQYGIDLVPDSVGRRTVVAPYDEGGRVFEFIPCVSQALGYVDGGNTKYGILQNYGSNAFCIGGDDYKSGTTNFYGDGCFSDEPQLASQWWSLTTSQEKGNVLNFLGQPNTTDNKGTWFLTVDERAEGEFPIMVGHQSLTIPTPEPLLTMDLNI